MVEDISTVQQQLHSKDFSLPLFLISYFHSSLCDFNNFTVVHEDLCMISGNKKKSVSTLPKIMVDRILYLTYALKFLLTFSLKNSSTLLFKV